MNSPTIQQKNDHSRLIHWPWLPNELVVKILDTLASSDRQSCLALCLVSSWTRRIALPHLLHAVIISNRNHTAFIEGVVNIQHASYVKRLWIIANDRGTGSIPASCISITTLIAPPFIIDPFGSPPFQSLTHLFITSYPLYYDGEFMRCTFPCLTHFVGIVYSLHHFEFQKGLLEAYGAQLVMVVACVYDLWNGEVVKWMREERRVEKRMFLVSSDRFGLEQDWVPDARDSLWNRARRETRNVLRLDASDDA